MDIKNRIKDLPASERPYEKFKRRGEGALSDAELLAIILRCGIKGLNVFELSAKIISLCEKKGGIGYLGRITFKELEAIEGVGFVKAAQIRCIGELCNRMWEQQRGEIKTFCTANDVASYFNQYIKSIEKEETWILLFDSANHCIGKTKISEGTLNSSLLSSRDMFREALLSNAAGIILIHNHPSGNPKPSCEDKALTARIMKASEVMEVALLDHIILSDGKYYSFKQAGFI